MRQYLEENSTAVPRRLSSPRDKIRILTIIGRLNIGGAAIQAVSIAEHFNRNEFSCLLVAGRLFKGEGDMAYLAREAGVEPIFLRSLSREINPLDDFIAMVKILKIILKFRPHIIHTHTAKAGTVGRMAGFLAGTPVLVHTFHGHTLRHYFGKLKSRIFTIIERALARISSAVITTSPSLGNELVRILRVIPPNKSRVVWFGVDLKPFLSNEDHTGQLRKELSIPGDAPVVTIVARLCPIKDHQLFLHSAAVLLRSKPDARFIIVGDGELREELVKLSQELKIENNVYFLGWRRDLAAIYADSTVVAISSIHEATTVTLIEAMACRKPVVATAVGGMLDLFPDKKRIGELIHARTGIAVDSRDPEQYARALGLIISDKNLQSDMGREGRKFVKKNLSMERFLQNLELLYRNLLKGNH